MARLAYTALWWLALPFLPLRLWWRGRREPLYRARMSERFGRYAGAARAVGNDVLWIHAVSLGETRAIAPLVERLVREDPRRTIVLTHMTATGREAGSTLFGNRVVQAWLPYDVPFAVSRFLAHFHPRAGLLVETELWPNLAAAAAR
ncbi:MAG: glycosyltransferase N-terminal domain-containing protein, partial [Rudaea sp.]